MSRKSASLWLVLVALAGSGAATAADTDKTLDFALPGLRDETPIRLEDYRQKVVYVDVWASWCAPCRVETPQFQEVYAEVRDEGVEFLGLNVKEADEQFGQAFVDTQGIEFPSLYDPAGEVALTFRDYPANAIPSTIVLDREGRVAAVYTGEVSQDDLRAVLDLLLGEG